MFVVHQVCYDTSVMAKSVEDYLIDDDILTRQFNGTLAFAAETASSQAALNDIEVTGNQIFVLFFLLFLLRLPPMFRH